jgi:hypothetical protein
VDEAALQAGIARARHMLQNAADLAVVQEGDSLKVTITNNCGHKLPTGYPEGRRMWINVKFYDASTALVSESAAYDPNSGELSHEDGAKIYEVKPGLDETIAPLVGVDPGPSFHFVLNNKTFKDNRVPPRGFTNAAYAEFGGPPVAYSYADGQYWDDTFYVVPVGAASAEVTLYYQSTSKEFMEFLRDENTTNTKGLEMYNLWSAHGKCPPEVMASATVAVTGPVAPALLSSAPPAEGTLCKTQNNSIRLVFDSAIALPPSDEPLVIVELADPNNDLSEAFAYTVDPNDTGDPSGATLKAVENGAQLTNLTWYNVAPAPGFAVSPFSIDLCTLAGDCDSSGRITTADYSCVKAALGQRGDIRADLNGSDRVTTADYTVVKDNLGARTPAKP